MVPCILAGLVICALPTACWPWLWQNQEDGPSGPNPNTWLNRYKWSALRNSVGNARHTRLFGVTVDPTKVEKIIWRPVGTTTPANVHAEGLYLVRQGLWRYELKFSWNPSESDWTKRRIFWIGWRLAQQTAVTPDVGVAIQPRASL